MQRRDDDGGNRSSGNDRSTGSSGDNRSSRSGSGNDGDRRSVNGAGRPSSTGDRTRTVERSESPDSRRRAAASGSDSGPSQGTQARGGASQSTPAATAAAVVTSTAVAVAVDGPVNPATAPAPLVVVDGRLRLVTDSLLRALRRNPADVVVRPAATDRHRRSKAQLELRRLLLEAVGCADRLSQDQRDVLVLRVGGGPQRPLSRAEVADRLDVSRRLVTRVERSVREDLRRLAGEQACAAGTVTTGVAGGTTPAATAGAGSQAGGGPGAGAAPAGVNEVAGATESGGTTTRTASSGVAADRHESTGPVIETPLGTVDLFPDGTVGTVLAVSGVAGLAGLLASFLLGAARRRRRRAA